MVHKSPPPKTFTPVVWQKRKKLPDRITCGICGQNFTSRGACAEHMKVHYRERVDSATSRPSTAVRPSSSVSMAMASHRSPRPPSSGPRPGSVAMPISSYSSPRPPSSEQRPHTATEMRTLSRAASTVDEAPLSPKRAASAPSGNMERQRSARLKRESVSPQEPPPEVLADPERRYACFCCQAEFPDIMSLHKHSRAHGGSTPYSCTQCGRMFPLYSSLMTHEKSHLPDRPHTHRCQQCGAMFLHGSSLKAHQRRHDDARDGPDSRPYQCVTCHEWMSNEGSLKIHMQRHETFDKPRTCSLCGTSFSNDTILKAHAKLHEAESTNRCVICMRHFRRSRVLLRHSDVHADERQNVCDSCEKRFPKVADGSWRRMQLLLPEDPKFQCLYCGAGFSRLYLLAAHEAGHRDPPLGIRDNHRVPVVVVN